MSVTLDNHSVVKVRNVAPPEHRFGKLTIFHGPNQQWTIPSGGEDHVPYYVAKSWFGDSRSAADFIHTSANSDLGVVTATIPPRKAEVARLRAHYGLTAGRDDVFVDNQSEIPQVELTSVDGDKIPTVLEDPEGHTTISASTTQSQAFAQQQTIAKLQAQVELLMSKLTPEDQITSDIDSDPELDGFESVQTLPTDDAEGDQ